MISELRAWLGGEPPTARVQRLAAFAAVRGGVVWGAIAWEIAS